MVLPIVAYAPSPSIWPTGLHGGGCKQEGDGPGRAAQGRRDGTQVNVHNTASKHCGMGLSVNVQAYSERWSAHALPACLLHAALPRQVAAVDHVRRIGALLPRHLHRRPGSIPSGRGKGVGVLQAEWVRHAPSKN